MSCEKTAYPNERNARREARRIRHASGEPFRAYVCDGQDGTEGCGKWHLSSHIDEPPASTLLAPGRRPRGNSRLPVVRTREELESLAAKMRGGSK